MPLVEDLGCGLSLCICFIGGWLFFDWSVHLACTTRQTQINYLGRFLMREYEVKNQGVRCLFVITWTLSCSMFELIIFEILNLLSKDHRWILWKVRAAAPPNQYSAPRRWTSSGSC